MNKCERIEQIELHKLVPHPKNPNTHSEEQIERLAKLISYQGFRSPIVVSNQSGFIIVGHGRLEAAKGLGLETVPVIYQDFKDEAQEYAHMTADNAIGSWSKLDFSQINTDILELGPELNIELLGIKEFTVDPSEIELPDLKAGDNGPCQKVTFTLSDEQVDKVKEAMEKAKSFGPIHDDLNENSNGNALARVAELFISSCDVS